MIKSQKGFSLLEIFISLAVGLVLFAGVMSVFVGMRTTTSETTSFGALQENGRFALAVLSEDISRQGLWGDLYQNISTDNVTPIPNINAANDCVGEGLNNASFPQAVGYFRTIWGMTTVDASPINCITNATIGSDVLQLKRVLARPIAQVGGATDNSRYFLNSNLAEGAIFQGDAATPQLNNGRVWEYQHHVYYVRNDVQADNTIPVLMQGTLSLSAGTAMNFNPLIDGIEMIRFMYGVDTDNDGVSAVNEYISAENMPDAYWDNSNGIRILAVKIYVLARDILPDAKYQNDNTYQMGDLPVNFGDNYRRLMLSSTVRLYNREG